MIAETLDCVLRAARHLMRQGWTGDTGFEVIVVDNGSSDGTAEFLSGYAAHNDIHVYRLAPPGAARARNFGRQHASGEILVFVDADTQVPLDSFVRIVEHCQRRGCRAGITRLGALDGGFRARAWWTLWEHVRRLPLSRAKAMPALMFCTASLFDEFGPFDESVAIGEEWPILARLYRTSPRSFIYDRSLTARSSSRRMEQQAFGYLRTFVKYAWAILHRSGRIDYTDRIR